MSLAVSKRVSWQDVQNKRYEVTESAMARANGMAGKKFSFYTANKIARTICKFTFLEFKRSLREQFPSNEYSSSLKLAFLCSEHLLLCQLYSRIIDVIFPEEVDPAEDLKDRSIKMLPPDSFL